MQLGTFILLIEMMFSGIDLSTSYRAKNNLHILRILLETIYNTYINRKNAIVAIAFHRVRPTRK